MAATELLIGQIDDALADVDHTEEQIGGSRELSLVRTKLEEARHWARDLRNDRKERGLE